MGMWKDHSTSFLFYSIIVNIFLRRNTYKNTIKGKMFAVEMRIHTKTST